jgi:hypothetical protein
MLWFKKQPDKQSARERDVIEPADISLPFDAGLFQQHLSHLRHLAEQDAGGLEAYMASLQAKQQLFASLLGPGEIDTLSLEKLEALLETVFTARRRVYPTLEAMGNAAAVQSAKDLLYGEGELQERMQAFVDALPIAPGDDKESQKSAVKTRRAAFDFAAEMLHFNDPVRYPLMTRWVWDQNTVSGALREFIRGNDHMAEIPLGNSPEMFEGTRQWLAGQVGEQGIYKDVPLWIDLVLAEAYAAYFRSMAEGVLSADFGRSGGPEEHVKKFLGIDGDRRGTRSRVKKDLQSTGANPA